jgi:chromosome partitioning protein
LTVNALTASHGVLIPLACEFFALRGVALLLDTVEKVKARLNPNLQLDGILPTMYDPRTLHSVEVLELVTKNRPKDVLKSIIRRTVKFPDSTVAAAPITVFAPEHQAAESYRELARELISLGKIA